MAELLPAILTDDTAQLQRQVRAVETFAPFFHLDLTEPAFSGAATVSPEDVAAVRPAIPFEVHLMVRDPLAWFSRVLACGPQRVIVHCADPRHLTPLLAAAGDVELAIAFGHTDDADTVVRFLPFLHAVRQVTFVSVLPGYQGGAFIPDVAAAAAAFKRSHPQQKVELDGGIHPDTIEEARATGADRFVGGSVMWTSDDPRAAYEHFHQLLEGK